MGAKRQTTLRAGGGGTSGIEIQAKAKGGFKNRRPPFTLFTATKDL